MSFFNTSEPILRRKQHDLDLQDLQGLWRIHWRVGNVTLLSTHYTRIDQVFILWGLLSAAIFITAQFLPLAWTDQAILWSLVTVLGIGGMVSLSWSWAVVERASWIVGCWVVLMVVGLALTDLSVFAVWGEVLLRLGPLWLGLSAIGYLCTGLGLRSRALFLTGVTHLLSAVVLLHIQSWQFLFTGGVMASSLILLGEVQWDMRQPIDHDLSEAQKQFNREQHRLRQIVASSNS